METILEFLISKNKFGYALVAILFFGFPGFIFVFVWNREVFITIDIFKLILLSFAITFMIFIPNAIYSAYTIMLEEKVRKREPERFEALFMSIGLSFFAMSLAMIYKLIDNKFTVIQFIACDVVFLFVGVILKAISEFIYFCRHRKK